MVSFPLLLQDNKKKFSLIFTVRTWLSSWIYITWNNGGSSWLGASGVFKSQGCPYCCCCYVALVVSNSVRPHRWQPTRYRQSLVFSMQEQWSGLPFPCPYWGTHNSSITFFPWHWYLSFLLVNLCSGKLWLPVFACLSLQLESSDLPPNHFYES